jgi:outer membrane protein assembly factor BamE (lipoprotein component of BamABCDE complex)
MRITPKVRSFAAGALVSGRNAAIAAVVALCVAGCSTMTAPFDTYIPYISQFGIYKLDINQGNYISQDMVDKLKEGQTRQQVRTVLGTPLLVSVFRDNRWDYLYEYRKNGRVQTHRQFTVYFQGDVLARWEGDEMPKSVQELNRTAATRSLPDDPYGDDAGIMGKIIDWFNRLGDPSAGPVP